MTQAPGKPGGAISQMLDSVTQAAYRNGNPPKVHAFGPVAFAGIAIRQRVAPTGAFLLCDFAAGAHMPANRM